MIVIHLKHIAIMLSLTASLVAIVPTANADGPCDGVMNAGVCVALDPATGCADVAVQVPPPFSPPLPIHVCSPAWVTIEYGAQCLTITVKVSPPLSQPLPIVLCP